MRGHVKTVTAGSTSVQAGRSRDRARLFVAALTAVVLALALVAPLATAAKSVVDSVGGPAGGTLGAQFNANGPSGVAVNNSTGDIYVADRFNNRVQRFGASGDFISAWGFNVIEAGKTNDLGSNVFEVCTVAEECRAGITNVSPSPGGQLNNPKGIAVDQATGNIYVLNTSLRIDVFSAGGSFLRAFGQDVVQSGKAENNPPAAAKQSLKVDAAAGQFKLSFKGQSTPDLPYNASAAEVQAALQGLSTIGAGNATVTGGPGDEGGTTPYAITFAGALTNSPQPLIAAANGATPLSGGAAGATVSNTTTGSSGFEVCTTAANCKVGVAGATAGAFANFGLDPSLAVVPPGPPNAGNLLVPDRNNRRVQEFTPTGGFVRTFGFDVARAPTGSGTTFEICSAADFDVCQAGSIGTEVGQFGNSSPTKVAVDANGVIYTVEQVDPNFRVQRFTPSGSTLTPSLFGTNEVQTITVNATAGQFRLTLGPSTTTDLDFNATASEVQTALNALESINTGGGSVSVSGPSGGPYVVTFDGGPRRNTYVPALIGSNGTTPLSGGSGPGANKALAAITTAGAPNALPVASGAAGGEDTSPTDVAIGPSNNLLVLKWFPAGATPNCLRTNVLIGGALFPAGNAPSVNREARVLELAPSGALLDTSLTCAGITAAISLARDATTDRLFLTSTFPTNTAQVYVLDDVTPPTATIDPVTKVDAFSATLEGEVNPQGSATECRFDYISQAAFDQNVADGIAPFTGAGQAPCEEDPGSGTGPIVVSAQINGDLNPNTPYKVRLVAMKPAKPFFGEVATDSATESFTSGTVPPPTAITGAVAPRGTTTARLSGLVNPNASPTEPSPTEAYFEYGTAGPCSANPCTPTTPPQGVGDRYILPGEPFARVSAELTGLEPDTTYHYRLIATNDNVETGVGTDRTFQTRSEPPPPGSCPNEDVRQAQNSDGYLGSCRAIELVNQPDKGNQNVFARIGLGQDNPMVTPDGEGALWWVVGGAPGATASAGSTFFAERTESGWRSRNLVPPPAEQFGNTDLPYAVEKATPDLDAFLFIAGNSALSEAGKTLIRLDRDQNQEVLGTYEGGDLRKAEGSEITDDGAQVLIVNPDTKQLEAISDPLTEPEKISLMPPPGAPLGVPVPGGAPSACGLSTTGASFAGSDTAGGQGAGVHWNPGYRMIETKDASRAYFQARPDGDCGGLYGLYVRNRVTGATTPIDYGALKRNVGFIRATPDGKSAYFATFSQLDPDDKNTGADVYLWEEAAGESSCLTCVVPNANIALPAGSADLAQVMVSDDFSHVYFQSKEQLVPGHGEEGTLNTYALSDGEIHFVAGEGVGRLGRSSDSAEALLSVDGNVLLFASAVGGGGENLTTDDLATECVEAPGLPLTSCRELYRYDDRDGSLECVSCVLGGETTFSRVRAYGFAMSADGRTIAFGTFQRLIQDDVNQGGDLYEWRNGAVSLLSDGVRRSPVDSFARPEVRGIDADGDSVFFTLTAPGLTGFEQDGVRNLYSARIGGGFIPPTPPVHCIEDSCQGPLQAAPGLESAATSNESRGNVVERSKKPRPCAKKRGKAKRRCIRKQKQRRRAQHARANHNVGRGK